MSSCSGLANEKSSDTATVFGRRISNLLLQFGKESLSGARKTAPLGPSRSSRPKQQSLSAMGAGRWRFQSYRLGRACRPIARVIFESRRGNKGYPRAFTLDKRVGSHRRAMAHVDLAGKIFNAGDLHSELHGPDHREWRATLTTASRRPARNTQSVKVPPVSTARMTLEFARAMPWGQDISYAPQSSRPNQLKSWPACFQ